MTTDAKKKAAQMDQHRAAQDAQQGTLVGGKPLQSTPDNSAEAQRFRILEALRAGPKTSLQLRQLGAYQAPARVRELRLAGHEINTTLVTLIDPDGYAHPRAALYSLCPEASQGEVGRGG